ncbi:MAG: OmpA family protein [Chitinispirillaceae bacterium]|nr:OmpA family protein [Chitinispirillaceae bacterium]
MSSDKTGAAPLLGVCMLLAISGALFSNDLNTGGQRGVVRTLSTATLGKSVITAGGGFYLAKDREYAKGTDGSGTITALPNMLYVRQTGSAELWSGDLFVACGLNSFLDVSANLPVYRDVTGWGPAGSGAGDLEIAVKLRYPDSKKRSFFSSAYYLRIMLPTAADSGFYFPRNSFHIQNDARTGADAVWITDVVYVNPMFVWTFDFSLYRVPAYFHANIGAVHGAGTQATALAAALAAEVRAAPAVCLFVELTGEARIKYFSDSYTTNPFAKDPVRLTSGLRLRMPGGFYCIASGDIGIADEKPEYRANWNRNGYQYSTKAVPRWGGQVILGWTGRIKTPDGDRDSVPDTLDRCPDLLEDRDGYEDADGCPDHDNDKDGVPDSIDKCDSLPEDSDGFEDTDGCPDTDNDRDGLADPLDVCRNLPEDRNGYKDDDGCPDGDNDRDGFADSLDKCPNLAEDIDGFEDADGCPEYDNDGDGVADSIDKCLSEAGPAADGGCPVPGQQKRAGKRGPLILNGVMFASGKALLTQASQAVLDRVAHSLLEWSEVRVEIRGYNDLMEADRRLSLSRAEAVRDYLLLRGIAPERLTAAGAGKANPIASNNSAAGRQKNRRVELIRID